MKYIVYVSIGIILIIIGIILVIMGGIYNSFYCITGGIIIGWNYEDFKEIIKNKWIEKKN